MPARRGALRTARRVLMALSSGLALVACAAPPGSVTPAMLGEATPGQPAMPQAAADGPAARPAAPTAPALTEATSRKPGPPATRAPREARPFSATSPWNTPLPNRPRFASKDDPRMRAWLALQASNPLGLNHDRFTIWRWQATREDPEVSVSVSVHHLDSMRDEREPRACTVRLRMPPQAHPDPGLNQPPWVLPIDRAWADEPDGRDAHMVVIDPDGRHAHEFWHLERDQRDGRLKAAAYARVPLDGEGVWISGDGVTRSTGKPHNPAFETCGWGATRAYGGSSLGGLLVDEDFATDDGPAHAIALALPQTVLGYPADGKTVPYPASKDDGRSHGYTGVVLMGTRFAIPPEVDLATLGLQGHHLKLARALQRYGAYVVDQAGRPVFYAGGIDGKAAAAALLSDPAALRRLHGALVIVDR